MSAAELCLNHGISDATFYKWRSRYGGLEVSEARRLKALEGEARARHRFEWRGRTLLTPGSRRDAMSWAIEERGYSRRRACALVGMAPRAYR